MQEEAQPLLPRLRTPGSPLGELLDRAERISALNQALRQWTQEPWFDSIRLVNLRGDTVVLFATNAAALVPLRYRQQALLAFLQERFQLPCVKVTTKVQPLVHTGFSESKQRPGG